MEFKNDFIADAWKDHIPKKLDYFHGLDQFDFFRKPATSGKFLPRTQAGLLKAFSEGLIGIENFLHMAASLKPLEDTMLDVDDLIQTFAIERLVRNPDLVAVTILRKMLKNEDSEIAMYAAEGINSIETRFIAAINIIHTAMVKNTGQDLLAVLSKNKRRDSENDDEKSSEDELTNLTDIEKRAFLEKTKLNKKKYKKEELDFILDISELDTNVIDKGLGEENGIQYILHWLHSKLNLEFAKLHKDLILIQNFYLKEALDSALKGTGELSGRRNEVRIDFIHLLGEIYFYQKNYDKALSFFHSVLERDSTNIKILALLARTLYNKGDYFEIPAICEKIKEFGHDLNSSLKKAVKHWTG